MSGSIPHLAAFIIAVSGTAAGGCKAKPTPPICAEYAQSADILPDLHTLPADVWYSLLIEGVVRKPTLMIPDRPHECSGLALHTPEPPAGSPPSHVLPRPDLSERDMTLGDGPDGEVLVWTRIDYFDDGTAVGPIALALPVSRGVEIRGIGTLRAPYHRPRLRLEPFGEHDLLIVAEGDICDAEGGCRRRTNLLPLVRQRIIQPSLLEDGTTAGRAEIAAYERHETPSDDNSARRAEIHRTLRVDKDTIHVAETISLATCEQGSEPPKCTPIETVEHDRTLVWEDGAFTTTRSVWEDLRGP